MNEKVIDELSDLNNQERKDKTKGDNKLNQEEKNTLKNSQLMMLKQALHSKANQMCTALNHEKEEKAQVSESDSLMMKRKNCLMLI